MMAAAVALLAGPTAQEAWAQNNQNNNNNNTAAGVVVDANGVAVDAELVESAAGSLTGEVVECRLVAGHGRQLVV